MEDTCGNECLFWFCPGVWQKKASRELKEGFDAIDNLEDKEIEEKYYKGYCMAINGYGVKCNDKIQTGLVCDLPGCMMQKERIIKQIKDEIKYGKKNYADYDKTQDRIDKLENDVARLKMRRSGGCIVA